MTIADLTHRARYRRRELHLGPIEECRVCDDAVSVPEDGDELEPCRTKGDEKCAMELVGFVDGMDEKTGRRSGRRLYRCVTCGRMADSDGNLIQDGDW